MVHSSLNKSLSFHNPHRPLGAQAQQLTDEMRECLQAIQGLNLTIEICGSWVWVFGSDSSHAPKLSAARFKWSYKKQAWYLRPGNSKRCFYRQPWSMEKIRGIHGSQAVHA